ncbi:MAG: cytochrome c biogenesis protein CcdA [Dysgonamonadaceae bacterium]|nr:cytochrome c biogenesis protein CcdA [Dysgonamonadaceae bacterium]MDD3356420.1 cytochrome c biogenesis protein CcdA [Dysgonamonadaceae bacterium]MDD4245906.1 cytochrome c biogenesis protein CcdA [Dysgonamonadaceae bacterium]
MRKRSILTFLSVLGFIVYGFGQSSPTSWKFSLIDTGNGEIELVADVELESGWHLYDTKIPDGGPYPTSLSIDKLQGAVAVGEFKSKDSKLISGYDAVFEMNIGYYDGSAKFVQRFKVTDKSKFVLEGDVRAQACDDRECTPPLPQDFSFTSSDLPATVVESATAAGSSSSTEDVNIVKEDTPLETQDFVMAPLNISEEPSDIASDALWTPVIDELREYGMKGSVTGQSLWWILIAGFAGGIIALLTPCVWPLIPMTVSFFLKRNKDNRKKAISDAVLYGVAIIVIYVLLGLTVTGIFGASALNDLSTNAVFNLLFFALLVFFAISFFGAFELVLPASWTNKMDARADKTTGMLSIFFMAFTLALVSFSCTGPIIGTLLVETATSGSIIAPAIGMFGFALALAIPFSFFAIFPSWLESMPKSGGWLNSVKVVLGFLELALALKFFSVADLAYGWGILDRETFLVLWIVIFALLGIYLLGKLKLPHDSELAHVSVTRLFLSIISLSFALYMIPGLWGAPLKAISAFAPPMYTQDFNLYDGAVHAKSLDYEAGMAYAKQVNKPVLIDFSGYGCVNCRKMEASVWTDPRVKNLLDNEYVLITLMVDDKTRLPEIIEVNESGRKTKLKTIGDKWSYLQRHKFGANAQPYYIALDTDGNPISPSYAFDEDVDRYVQFLEGGLQNF